MAISEPFEVFPQVKTDRRIVICGSMSSHAIMEDISMELEKVGVKCLIPESDDIVKPMMSEKMFEEFKRRVSYAYLKKVKEPRTYAVLAVNPDKYGISNYIGPNTFAEIAVAFAQSKKIYILNDYPDVYADELSAWRAGVLRGDLNILIQQYFKGLDEETKQLSLFKWL